MKTFKIAKVIDQYRVAINAGSNQKLAVGLQFQIYELSNEEILDPDTGKSLGYLEIVKGTGKITNVQDHLATLESNQYRTYTVNSGLGLLGSSTIKKEQIPFNNPKVGDLVKPI